MNQRNRPLVSIIVPIYKVEAFLHECITSLIDQDYEDLQIILVDDGSPDGCGSIADTLSHEDERVVVIHKENGGVSSARNEGLAIAKGKYLMFVDGDDYVEPDYVSYFVSMMESNDVQIGVGRNAFYRDGQGQPLESIRTLDALEIVEGIYLNHFGVAVWNKIFRREIVTDHSLRFNMDFWYGEGMLFNIQYLQYAEKAVVGERRVYHVRPNQESATRLFKLENQYCGLRSMTFQRDHWLKSNQNVQTAWEYHYWLYAMHILKGLIETNGKKTHKKLFRKCVRILRTNLRIPLQARTSPRVKENCVLLAICPTGYIRDEIGIVRDKNDQSDLISRKLLGCARRYFSKIPVCKKEEFWGRIGERLQSNYRPKYLKRELL